MNEKLYIILSGCVTLQMAPPNPSLADHKLEEDAIFGNLELENMSPPEASETALVDDCSEFLIVSARDVKESIKTYHANVIAENIRFLSSSMLFRHWRKAQLYELASNFVIRTFEVSPKPQPLYLCKCI